MNKDELISIIIPVYNVKAYLKESLESVLGQTYTNLEIVIIDDGSCDGSGEICDQYKEKDNRIIVIHQSNKGLSAARNVGLNHASGDIIAFLDPDDAYHPSMIQIMTKEMKRNSADIVVCKFSKYETQGRMEPLPADNNSPVCNTVDKKEVLQLILKGEIDTAVWNKLYKRTIWDNLRFPEGYVYEGTYIVFDIFNRVNRIVLVDKELVMHRKRFNSICNTHSLKNVMDSIHAVEHYISFVANNTPCLFSYSQLKKVKRRYYKKIISDYMYYQCNNPNDEEGIQMIRSKAISVGNNDGFVYCCFLNKIVYKFIVANSSFCKRIYSLFRIKKNNLRRNKTIMTSNNKC